MHGFRAENPAGTEQVPAAGAGHEWRGPGSTVAPRAVLHGLAAAQTTSVAGNGCQMHETAAAFLPRGAAQPGAGLRCASSLRAGACRLLAGERADSREQVKFPLAPAAEPGACCQARHRARPALSPQIARRQRDSCRHNLPVGSGPIPTHREQGPSSPHFLLRPDFLGRGQAWQSLAPLLPPTRTGTAAATAWLAAWALCGTGTDAGRQQGGLSGLRLPFGTENLPLPRASPANLAEPSEHAENNARFLHANCSQISGPGWGAGAGCSLSAGRRMLSIVALAGL